jgi:DNA-binding NtrC family response regulator
MPGMNGRELFERAAEKQPDLKVLYMSGYSDDVIVHQGVLDEGVQLIQKPFSIQGLASRVREILEEK